ncbi:MAG: 4Fe-4S binding protein [Muribaculaceae bacterium]|nr:4Fe-4S binding protein [Muribaculaceae bacterium]
MEKRIIGIYFSATDTTRKYVKSFAEAWSKDIDIEINLADNLSAQLPDITSEDLVIVAAPVYGGRLPSQVSSRLKELKGNQAKVIAMVVYGNRDYDDALLELTDILSDADFEVIGAGAFIGQHSIFPKVASSRPDNKDLSALSNFANECLRVIETDKKGELKIKGNRPYKKAVGVPLHPSGDPEVCNRCGKCVEKCPVYAIKVEEPYLSDDSICISCGRCIYVCPKHTRRYSGLKYKMIGSVFTAAFSKRKEAEFNVI